MACRHYRKAAVVAVALAGMSVHLAAASMPRLEYHRYVVVGAGPAGLQMAHYLHSAGRDFIVVDQADEVAGFFARYPRFRHLISVNKRYVGTEQLEFTLRHDWNSLLAEPSHSGERWSPQPGVWTPQPGAHHAAAGVDVGQHYAYPGPTNSSITPVERTQLHRNVTMREWSADYYPHADRLVEYMAAFTTHQGLRPRLRLGWQVGCWCTAPPAGMLTHLHLPSHVDR